jgi:hypothetical protein
MKRAPNRVDWQRSGAWELKGGQRQRFGIYLVLSAIHNPATAPTQLNRTPE